MPWKTCQTLFLSLLTLFAGAAAAADDRAAAILRANGVQGGLVVHVGCGDGKLTAALHASDSYLVHGLDADAKNVEAARRHIQSLGLYGKVSVEQWTGNRLPYVDNLVNLLVISDGKAKLAEEEIQRVLAPQGVAIRLNPQSTIQNPKFTKPWPKEIDEWTHYLHGPDNNAVAHDALVGPPRHMQWVGSPRWSRHHDNMASMSALVSAGGRLFYILDEGQTSTLMTPSKWALIARDAFNGTVLWKCPIASWHTRFWPLKSGPAQLPRRLVADRDTVFATLGIDAPLSALDAATGRVLRTYEGTQATVEVLLSGGVLFVLVDPSLNMEKHTDPRAVSNPWWTGETVKIMAIRAATGEVLWQHPSSVIPLTLAVDEKHALFHDGERVVCLDRYGGQVLWRSEPIVRVKQLMSFFAPTLVAQQGIVLFAGGEESGLVKSTFGATKSDKLTALDAQTGRILWTGEHPPSGYSSPEDVLVLGDSVWCGGVSNGTVPGVMIGRDLRTGQVQSTFAPDVETYWFHHRCYRGKATDKYLMMSRTGIEFVDVAAKHWLLNHWIRGGCMYGIMPANGLIYAPPHDCICYPESKQFGLNAVAAASASRAVPRDVSDEGRLERGPAYEEAQGHKGTKAQSEDDWATYRHDAARSGATKTAVPRDLKQVWQADLGGKLSSVVLAEGKVFVAAVDTHKVYALDANSGKTAWSYTAGGRVDSPPSVYQGLALFGSADGYAYCLRAADGALAWRFRAAPVDRRITAFEQIESVWPVSGSVLVSDGTVQCVAGRSMFLDGGLRLLKLDAKTGRKRLEKVLDDRAPDGAQDLQSYVKWLNMPVALPDVLSTDGRTLYMRSQPLDAEGNRPRLVPISEDRFQVAADQHAEASHVFSPIGFLDDSWFHRAYWIYGQTFSGGWNGYYLAGKVTPAGRLLVVDDQTVFGYGRKPEFLRWTTPIEYQLFAAEKRIPDLAKFTAKNVAGPRTGEAKTASPEANKSPQPGKKGPDGAKGQRPDGEYLVQHRWVEDVPFLARAMVLTGAQPGADAAARTLFVAGPPDVVKETAARKTVDDPETIKQLAEQDAALEGHRGGILWAVSTADGKRLAEYRLDAPPVWDGMIAAGGRLFAATMDGKVICLGGH